MTPDNSEFLNQMFVTLHNSTAFVVQGRNITAGCARGIGIDSNELTAVLEEDPIYQHAVELAAPHTVVGITRLKNIFLILKYGLKETTGDIVELGSYRGGSALFMAQVARDLGLTKTIYALDTFEGMPVSENEVDLHQKNDFHDAHLRRLKALIRKNKLTNLVPLKGLFQKTVPKLLSKISSVALAHVDCDIYPSVHYSISALTPHMDPAGGYLIFDDPLTASCIGAMQAVEELLPAQGYRAEQIYPHLVYRVPKLKN
ncbi:MAG: TylF/MycF/NovP-related O-methyltransferase [Chthoniobacterales bacterium]